MLCPKCNTRIGRPLCMQCYQAQQAKPINTARLVQLRGEQAERDDYWHHKFWKDQDGVLCVRPGWNFNSFIMARVAGIPKTPSPMCAA